MYAIKAEFDGTKITPKEPVPVNEPYETIITFTRPAERVAPAKTVDDLDEFYGCFRENNPWNTGKAADSVEIIRKMRDEW
jgi:hypothetical protein